MKPYSVKLRGGLQPSSAIVVEKSEDYVTLLMNSVVIVQLREIHVLEHARSYALSDVPVKDVAESMVRTAKSNGCTPSAMVYLSRFVDTEGWETQSTTKGLIAQDKFKKEAETMAAKEKKLFGAAAASAKAKQQREAAKAKDAEKAYSEAAEKSIKKPKAKAKPKAKPKAKAKPNSKTVQKAKAAPSPKTKTKSDGFDESKLKNADGDWRSASAMFKGLIIEGGKSDKQIFAQVKRKFGLDDDKFSYVNWNRNWLKKQGVEVGDAS